MTARREERGGGIWGGWVGRLRRKGSRQRGESSVEGSAQSVSLQKAIPERAVHPPPHPPPPQISPFSFVSLLLIRRDVTGQLQLRPLPSLLLHLPANLCTLELRNGGRRAPLASHSTSRGYIDCEAKGVAEASRALSSW